jgi:homoserine O-succinyltransferase/O-acetyltransferase
MPVLLDRGPLGYRSFAAAKHLRSNPPPKGDANCIELGLINNMPDLALEQTERQILKLLDAAAGDILVLLKLYALPDVPRDDWGRKHLSRLHYYSIGDLWNSRLDGLIITGAEPRAPDLIQEPYWHTLTKVFDWAEHNTSSTILSCLAVHAAVYHLDGIGRHALDNKCFGVFEFEKVSSHGMVKGIPSRLRLPHSRWNEIRENALTTCGYDILVRGPDAGVDMFVKSRKSLFVFFQGHPEYEAWTLLGEYRRDIERFLKGEREVYPAMPQGYFDEESAHAFDALRKQALANRRKELIATFPTNLLAGKLTDTWRSAATQMYSNWLLHMVEQKAQVMRPGRLAMISTATPAR